jgi:adenosylcobyric acid synthase
MPALMIQGCGSDVGKSILTAGLCRVFANRGLRVRPFKPQNMSNNAAVTAEHGEIGRAQALQARACRVPPSVLMNPVLLKPQSDRNAQVVVQGRIAGNWSATEYQRQKDYLLPVVVASFRALAADSDLVLVEGAGSPAEINLRQGDIANMGFARATNTPVVLVGDIDRGHVIAALVGAQVVLDEADRALIHGFIVNKFRGEERLFDAGRDEIARRTGWRDLGLVPWLPAAARLPAEDSVTIQSHRKVAPVRIAVPMLSRMANFDEFDALRAEPAVDFVFTPPGHALPGDADLIILPGTKATISDLAFLRAQGWDIDLAAHVRRGGRVLGICGGYQMLGRRVADPQGMEGSPGEVRGLDLLDVDTVLGGDKTLKPARGHLADGGACFAGYEMHIGRTDGSGTARPFLIFENGAPDGATSRDGRVAGAHVHGLFASAAARASLLARFGAASSGLEQDAVIDAALDEIAEVLQRCLKIDNLARLAGLCSRRDNTKST